MFVKFNYIFIDSITKSRILRVVNINGTTSNTNINLSLNEWPTRFSKHSNFVVHCAKKLFFNSNCITYKERKCSEFFENRCY